MKNFTKENFKSSQDVRWCPGCGNYAILSSIQKTLGKLNIAKEKIAFVSGIGCSSRLPYYLSTYAFHTIHGRATSVASGLKLARPDISVWVATGDGDALSIGLHHLIHLMRKNINVNILLFNNSIYGLTKGQFSPTSKFGKITRTSPFGSIDTPLNPISVALASDCTFVARAIDSDIPTLENILFEAANHNGTSFVEIMQNCKVFNDKDYFEFADKNTREDNTILLEHNKPLIFGKEKNKMLTIDNQMDVKIVDYKDAKNKNNENETNSEFVKYNINQKIPTLAEILANLPFKEYPLPLGIFRKYEKDTYDTLIEKQNKMLTPDDVSSQKEKLKKLFNDGLVWDI